MKKTYKNKIIIITIAVAVGLVFSHSARAEAIDANSSLFQEVEQLRALKQSDPAAYRQAIDAKKARVQNNYQTLKERNPEKFERFMNQDQTKKKERLKALQQKNPQAFEHFKNQRVQRLQRMQKKNPEKFERLMKQRPEVAKRFQQKMNPRGNDQTSEGAARSAILRRKEQMQGQGPQNNQDAAAGFMRRKAQAEDGDHGFRDSEVQQKMRERFQQNQNEKKSGNLNRFRDQNSQSNQTDRQKAFLARKNAQEGGFQQGDRLKDRQNQFAKHSGNQTPNAQILQARKRMQNDAGGQNNQNRKRAAVARKLQRRG